MVDTAQNDVIDRVALAILNEERAGMDLPPAASVDSCNSPDLFRRAARAALNAIAPDQEQAR
jgi:hypothetical protein